MRYTKITQTNVISDFLALYFATFQTKYLKSLEINFSIFNSNLQESQCQKYRQCVI